MASPSNTQVNKAGKLLRKWFTDRTIPVESLERDPVFAAAADTVVLYRSLHEPSMSAALLALRSTLDAAGIVGDVSQRLKRFSSILVKLARQPTMQMTTMQDVAGCRAVVQSLADVRRVQEDLGRKHVIVETYDYVTRPQESGYRGLHLIVEYVGRKAELQIRTPSQHEWALMVETLGSFIGADLKGGEGPPEVLDLFRAMSKVEACKDAGIEPTRELLTAAVVAGRIAEPILEAARAKREKEPGEPK